MRRYLLYTWLVCIQTILMTMTANAATTLRPPYKFDFSANGLTDWTILDVNNDGKTWKLYQGNLSIQYNAKMDHNDWAITPPVLLEAGKLYPLKYSAKSMAGNLEKMEVYMGDSNTSEAMTMQLVAAATIPASNKTYTADLSVKETGLYYIGFHAISPKNKNRLTVSSISIGEGQTAGMPGSVTDLSAVPDPGFALKATVSFKAPSVNAAGGTLESISKIEVKRGNDLIKIILNPTPGEALTYIDETPVQGDNTWSVTAYNADGAGQTATVSAFVGLHEPVKPENFRIWRTGNGNEIAVSWDPVTTDIKGNAIPEGMVQYTVRRQVREPKLDLVTLATDLKETSLTFVPELSSAQEPIEITVRGYCGNQTGKGTSWNFGIPAGTPYSDYSESFSGAKAGKYYDYSPIGKGQLIVVNDSYFTSSSGNPVKSQDADNGLLAMLAQSSGDGAVYATGLISLKDMEHPALTFYVYNHFSGNPDTNDLKVEVRKSSTTEFTTILNTTINGYCGDEKGWHKVTCSLEAFKGEDIDIHLTTVCKQYKWTQLDNFSVGSVTGYDLEAGPITTSRAITSGMDYEVRLDVSNKGSLKAENWQVELYADDTQAAVQQGLPLDEGKTAQIIIPVRMSPFAGSKVTLSARIIYSEDEVPENNQTLPTEVEVRPSTLPTASNLQARTVNNGGSVFLSWNAPDMANARVLMTEDFENGESFAESFGTWNFVDKDQQVIGGITGITLPNITGDSKSSFRVWDNARIAGQFQSAFRAASGNKCLFSLYPQNDTVAADDWAISPLLCGGSQTISFMARSFDAQAPERIAVYYSTGSVAPENFIPVPASIVEAVPDRWTEYRVQLPDEARYFAIRSYALGGFILFIDDVEYIPANSGETLSLAGYNIWRDGEKVNDTPVQECEYSDMSIPATRSEHNYVVTAVFTGMGESAASNEASASVVSGIDRIADGNRHETGRFSIDGASVTHDFKGMVIITYSDGTARKAIMK